MNSYLLQDRFATQILFYNYKLLKKTEITLYYTTLLNFSSEGLLNSTELLFIQTSISAYLIGQIAFGSSI